MDLIERQKAKEEILAWATRLNRPDDLSREDVMTVIDSIETAMGWISAKERLPNEETQVLCWYEFFRFGDYNRMWQDFGIGYVYDGMWHGDVSYGSKAKVLYWMPLPLPPDGRTVGDCDATD